EAELQAQFGEDVRITWNLHPPMLRALGMKRKVKLGSWFKPGFEVLRSMKVVRGTGLDLFGRTEVRRIERALPEEYRAAIERVLPVLGPANHEAAVALASLPDIVRGYEQIKLDNVKQYRDAMHAALVELNVAGDDGRVRVRATEVTGDR